jgi:Transposase
MAKHRCYSIEFKRQVAQEFIAGETLHGLAKRHDISRNLIRVWVAKYEAGSFDEDAVACPASPDSRRASVRWPSRRATNRVRRLRAPGTPDCRRQPAGKESRQNVPSRIRRASSPRLRGRRVAASSWSRCTSTVRRIFSTRSALRPACRAPKRTAATAVAPASHPRSVSTLRSSQPSSSSHISAGPCDDHRCEPTA